MRHMPTSIAALALAFLPSPAAADGIPGPKVWTQVRTAQGCLIYWPRPAAMSEAEFHRDFPWSFEGTGCEPNRPLTGIGRLSNPAFGVRGRFVNGVLDALARRMGRLS